MTVETFVGGTQRCEAGAVGVPVLAPAAQGFPAMLDRTATRRNSLRALQALRSDKRRKHEVEARCARWPSHLRFSAAHRHTHSASLTPLHIGWGMVFVEIASSQHTLRFSTFLHATSAPGRQVVCRWASLCAAEQHSLGDGARSALQPLTRGDCLSGAGQVTRVASFAAHPQGEQRREVGATRRPAHREAHRHTACRQARSSQTETKA